MSEDSVTIKVGINPGKMINAVAKALDVKYLNEFSKPTSPIRAIIIAEHILQNLSDTFLELSKDEDMCIHLAKALDMDQYFTKDAMDEDLSSALDKKLVNMPEVLEDILKVLAKHKENQKKN